MFPTDNDFALLYITYVVMFLFLMHGFIYSVNKSFYKWNGLFFVVYLGFMIYVFLDSENFKYGNSLAVLFYGLVIVLFHFFIMGTIKLCHYLGRK